jgi:hypothetical protein
MRDMAPRVPDDDTIQDIRGLLSAADPAADRSTDADAGRLRQIRASVMTPRGAKRDRRAARKASRPWRPGPLRRRPLIVTAIAVPVLLAATGAGWLISLSPAALRVSPDVLCYAASTAASSRETLLTASRGQSPTAVCAQAWATGSLLGLHPGHYPVPRLVACALPAARERAFGGMGTAGVFPDTTCARLHLAPLPAGYAAAARAVSALQRVVEHEVNVPQCQSRATVVAEANRALSRFRLTGWKVTYPFGTSLPARWKGLRACWSAQVNSAAAAIQAYPSIKEAPPGWATTIVTRGLQVPAAQCAAGRPPQSEAETRDRIQSAWQHAEHRGWTLRITFASPRASYSDPCYHVYVIGESPTSRTFTVGLSAYARPGR